MTPNLSDKELDEILSTVERDYIIESPILLTNAEIRSKAKSAILALFTAAQQQLLTELMEHQELVIEHGANYEDKKQYWAVPTSVIEQYQSNLKGKVAK